jgi:sugar lactone lactonase YvrE
MAWIRRVAWLGLSGLGLAYLLAWPIPNRPQAWQAPADPGYSGPHARNNRLAALQLAPLSGLGSAQTQTQADAKDESGAHGPEHILAAGGKLYAGLSNGDVVSWSPESPQTVVRVVNTGGRPLGLDMDAQGRLIVADAMNGVLRVTLAAGAAPRIEPVLTQVQHPVPDDRVAYADAVKVGAGGVIWVTDASRRFGAKAWGSTFDASVQDTMEHSCTGRLIALDPQTLLSRVALQGLCFPNGLAFSGDGKTLYVAETGAYRILALDLARLSLVRTNQGETGVPTLKQAADQGAARVFIDNLPGFPDNLSRSPSGRIWVGLTKPRSHVLDVTAGLPWVRSLVLRLPKALLPVPKPYGHIIAFDDSGRIVDDLQDPQGAYPETTSATEAGGRLFVHSLDAGSIGWMPYNGPR